MGYPDHPAQRDVADRFYLLQDHRLGLDVPVDRARRLLVLHHRLQAVQHDAAGRLHRHARPGARGFGLRPALRSQSTDPADRRNLGCSAHVHHRPRLLRDNGPNYIAGELAEYIEAQRMSHVRVPRSIHKLKARSNAGTRP